MTPPSGTSNATPVTLRSTMDSSSGKTFGFHAGTTLRQGFVALDDARATELGVRMGANQSPYGVHLRVWVEDEVVFEQDYENCVQRESDWATVFDLSGGDIEVNEGDEVVFELTPTMQVGIEPLQLTDPELLPGALDGYGTIYARYYMSGTPIPPVPPEASGVAIDTTSAMEHGRGAGAVTICELVLNVPPEQNAVVGQQILWNYTQGPNLQTTSTHLTITGNPIRGYESSVGERYGRVIPLQVNQQPVEYMNTFYWTVPGDYTVTFRVTANLLDPPCDNPGPQTVERSCTFHVLGPRIQSSLLVTSDVYRTTRAVVPGVFWPAVRLGSAIIHDEDDLGCLMRATVYTPPNVGSGQLRGVQLTRYESRSDDYIEIHSTGGAELLDGTEQYNDDQILANEGLSVIRLDDNPVQATNPAYDHLRIEEHFRMFIQWKSNAPLSIWVTLGIFNWFWRAGLLKAQDGSWAVVPNETDFSARQLALHRDASLIAGTELPEWSGVCPQDELVVTAPGFSAQGVPPISLRNQSPFIPQAGRQQMWVSMWTRSFGINPGRVLTQAELEEKLGEKVVASRMADGTMKYCTWMVPPYPPSPVTYLPGGIFVGWHIHTAEDAMPTMDLGVRPGLTGWVFGLQVAPFCFGNLSYWNQRARTPIDGSGETDQSYIAYTNKLFPLLPQGTRIQQAGDGVLRLTFNSAPTLQLLQSIASWPQTHHLRRYTDQQIIDPTDPGDLG